MNNIPKISIIVPIYNIEKYISKCIDSVLSQTYKDWELILVDDGCTDNSGKICDEYAQKDSRIKVIHKENEGVTATRHRGVKEAKGEFLFFIDGDDYITENALELFTNKQQENDADLVRGDFVLCNEKVDIIPSKIKNFDFDNKYDWLKCVIEEGGYIWNSLIKKNLYIDASNISNEITLSEDLLISFKLFEYLDKTHKLNSPTYYYRQHINSACHSYNVSEKKMKETFKSILLVIEGISKVRDKYKFDFKNNNILIDIDLLISSRVFIHLLSNKIFLKEHKKDILKLYIRYFALNLNVQQRILKDSWKCYLSNWWSITKFI